MKKIKTKQKGFICLNKKEIVDLIFNFNNEVIPTIGIVDAMKKEVIKNSLPLCLSSKQNYQLSKKDEK